MLQVVKIKGNSGRNSQVTGDTNDSRTQTGKQVYPECLTNTCQRVIKTKLRISNLNICFKSSSGIDYKNVFYFSDLNFFLIETIIGHAQHQIIFF